MNMTMTPLKFIHIGMHAILCTSKILAIFPSKTKVSKEQLRIAKAQGSYMDASGGRPIRGYILMDDHTLVASALSPKSLAKRMEVFAWEVWDDSEQTEYAAKLAQAERMHEWLQQQLEGHPIESVQGGLIQADSLGGEDHEDAQDEGSENEDEDEESKSNDSDLDTDTDKLYANFDSLDRK
jgi:regulator of extracellular matrix RemA (YlzA/DUF370 family)